MNRLRFGLGRETPVVLQTEAAECGLACLAMVAGHHGLLNDLPALRRRFGLSAKGATLAQLMQVARDMSMAPRALRLELSDLAQLKTPCVLHWDLNHFVVLDRVTGDKAVILDPAHGERTLSLPEVSPHFTGVALELVPTAEFKPKDERAGVTVAALWRGVSGVLGSLAGIALVSIAIQLVVLAMPWFMQVVVDQVVVSADRDLLTVLALGFGLLVVFQTLLGALRTWMITFLSVHLNLELTTSLYRHLLSLPMQFFIRRHIGDVVSRFGSADAIQRTLTTSFIEALVDGLMGSLALVMLIIYSWKLAAVVLGFVIAYFLLRSATFRFLRAANEEQIVHLAKRQSSFIESIRGLQAIKLGSREGQREGLFLNLSVDAANAGVRVARIQMLANGANALLFGLEHVLIIWLGAHAVLDGAFTVGMLFAFVSYKTNFSGRIAALIEKYFEYRMLDLHADRIADIVLADPEPAGDGFAGAPEAKGALRLEGVGFRYSDSDPWLFRGISIDISPGEAVAFSGRSGCGKSTLLKLILGLLPPSEGRVLVDGLEVGPGTVRALRGRFGVVMQDDTLFGGGIAENIAFFDDHIDHELVMRCAMAAAIHDEIVAMPMGYNTLVGDMGGALSGGQVQRLLLARALYRKPKVLLLDEATSHLDGENEARVNAAIRALGVTRVFVAHRAETLAMADRVIDLQGLRQH